MPARKKITASKARYLAQLYQLDPHGKGIRSVVLAERLGVSRPSVHAMIMKLQDLGYVNMEHYGIIFLTEQGQKTGKNCMDILREKAAHENSL